MRLGRDIDARINQLRGTFGEIGDQRLTVMAAITISDELAEARARIRALESDLEGQREARASALARLEPARRRWPATIDEVAERIEQLASDLAPREKVRRRHGMRPTAGPAQPTDGFDRPKARQGPHVICPSWRFTKPHTLVGGMALAPGRRSSYIR